MSTMNSSHNEQETIQILIDQYNQDIDQAEKELTREII